MESIILFAPLLGAVLAGFGWRYMTVLGAQIVAAGLMAVAAVLAWLAVLIHDGTTGQYLLARWIESGTFSADWSMRVDRLSLVMLALIATLSALVQIYSFGYMAQSPHFKPGEEGFRARFQAYLSFFSFAMMMLVLSDTLLQLIFGWQALALASYLLTGFCFRKPGANRAALVGFVTLRVSDAALILAAAVSFAYVDSVRLDDLFAAMPGLATQDVALVGGSVSVAAVLAFLILVAAMGKAALVPLSGWMSRAMEAPSPVSALVHGGLMGGAGVFLLCRLAPVMQAAPGVQGLAVALGLLTALFGASAALAQTDIKTALGYVTIWQMGQIFVALGLGETDLALVMALGHGGVMALIFLAAGSVIHAMGGELDLRNYGGLRPQLRWSFRAMVLAGLSLSGLGLPFTPFGLPGLASQGALLTASDAALLDLGLLIAALTGALAVWRLVYLTFLGKARGDRKTHEAARKSPAVMLLPMAGLAFFVLAVGLFAQALLAPEAGYGGVWPLLVLAAALFAIRKAYHRSPTLPGSLAERFAPLHRAMLNGWYLDAGIDRLLIRPAQALGRIFWKRGDEALIRGRVSDGVSGGLVPAMARLAGRAQTGLVFTYGQALLIGMGLLVLVMLLSGGGR